MVIFIEQQKRFLYLMQKDYTGAMLIRLRCTYTAGCRSCQFREVGVRAYWGFLCTFELI